jgi:hypothetical protein
LAKAGTGGHIASRAFCHRFPRNGPLGLNRLHRFATESRPHLVMLADQSGLLLYYGTSVESPT